MKILDYEIAIHDEKNLRLSKNVRKVAAMDYKDGDGNVTIPKGTEYEATDFVGFYQSPESAIRAILAKESFLACEEPTLADALARIAKAKEDLSDALKQAGLEAAR